ncbi:MAG: hypothetical protein JNM84_12310 [Planctomycetes bacterium]|nr:hypothetical protein [Planctomycetota bacterium]
MRNLSALLLASLGGALAPLAAQCPSSSCSLGLRTAIVPSFRGAPGSEFAGWLNTCQATAPNLPDEAASTTNDATLLQLDPNAVVTISCNLYNFRAISRFRIEDRAPGLLQEVVLQVQAVGTPIDPLSYRLVYLDAQNQRRALPPTTSGPLAAPEETIVTWDLAPLGESVQSYALEFDALGTSCSLSHVQLDTRSAPRPLYADRERLSRVQGGLQHLLLDAGPSHAGQLYAVLGSASGTTPGLYLGPNLELALAFDAYMIATLQLANSTYLLRTVGTLDAQGQGSASIAVPPAGIFSDLELHHGFFVADANGAVVFVSNPQVLELRR